MKNYSPPKIGIYYYPWYNATRWSLHPRRNTPVIGEYDSENLELIQYHVLQLQELGVDYVVIEMLPVNDWGFKSNFRSTQLFIECLKKTSIEYTFLIDTAVGTGHKDSCKYFSCLLEDLQKYDLIPTKKKW